MQSVANWNIHTLVCGWLLFNKVEFLEFQKCFSHCLWVCVHGVWHTYHLTICVCFGVCVQCRHCNANIWHTHTDCNTVNWQKLLRYITSFSGNDAVRCMNIPHRWHIFKMFDAHFIHNYNVVFHRCSLDTHIVFVYMDFQCQIVLNKSEQYSAAAATATTKIDVQIEAVAHNCGWLNMHIRVNAKFFQFFFWGKKANWNWLVYCISLQRRGIQELSLYVVLLHSDEI